VIAPNLGSKIMMCESIDREKAHVSRESYKKHEEGVKATPEQP